MLSPEGEPQCNRCRKVLDIGDAKAGKDDLLFCNPVCRDEFQITNGFWRLEGTYLKSGLWTDVVPRRHESTPPPRRRNDTDEFRREDVQAAGWKTTLWVVLAMCAAFKLATVYLQWQRGEAITFGGQIVIKGRSK